MEPFLRVFPDRNDTEMTEHVFVSILKSVMAGQKSTVGGKKG